uniref:ABC1 atypical kinase-like domain-containing protein n=1 Tax=Lactuca sativa TaxID=4236 RepID=A0A9R1XG38_LACSA|nr:hypothetical protein LSAT_V11C400166960 [Lactuca sativa]
MKPSPSADDASASGLQSTTQTKSPTPANSRFCLLLLSRCLQLKTSPIAAASLGQVYKGRLKENGDLVDVKVQRPYVLETVTVDLFIIRNLGLALRRFPQIQRLFQSPSNSLQVPLAVGSEVIHWKFTITYGWGTSANNQEQEDPYGRKKNQKKKC